MTLNVDELVKLFPQLALVIVVVGALGWAFLSQRTGKDDEGRDIKRSALLVPGWTHDKDLDEAHAETARVRKFYEVALREAQKQADARTAESRSHWDQVMALAVDLTRSQSDANRDLAVALQILRQLADRDSGQSEAPRG